MLGFHHWGTQNQRCGLSAGRGQPPWKSTFFADDCALDRWKPAREDLWPPYVIVQFRDWSWWCCRMQEIGHKKWVKCRPWKQCHGIPWPIQQGSTKKSWKQNDPAWLAISPFSWCLKHLKHLKPPFVMCGAKKFHLMNDGIISNGKLKAIFKLHPHRKDSWLTIGK